MEAEKDLLLVLGGPSGLGLVALFGFSWGVLKSEERSPVWTWLMIAAGALSVVLCVTFLALSSGRVFASWMATGTVEPILVLLSMAWFVAIAALIAVLVSVKRACRHLVECYHPDETPLVVRWLRRWVERWRQGQRGS